MRPVARPVPGYFSVDVMIAWIDAAAHRLGQEDAGFRNARGRGLPEDFPAVRSIPPLDRAALDGFAVRADASLGAGAYNPLELLAVAIAAGDDLPDGMDAVVPVDCPEA